MTITIIAALITILAIHFDKVTLFRNRVFPPIAFAGVVTVITSLVLQN